MTGAEGINALLLDGWRPVPGRQSPEAWHYSGFDVPVVELVDP
jgi:hypothetical protein